MYAHPMAGASLLSFPARFSRNNIKCAFAPLTFPFSLMYYKVLMQLEQCNYKVLMQREQCIRNNEVVFRLLYVVWHGISDM